MYDFCKLQLEVDQFFKVLSVVPKIVWKFVAKMYKYNFFYQQLIKPKCLITNTTQNKKRAINRFFQNEFFPCPQECFHQHYFNICPYHSTPQKNLPKRRRNHYDQRSILVWQVERFVISGERTKMANKQKIDKTPHFRSLSSPITINKRRRFASDCVNLPGGNFSL